jgi:hypothetical protein
MAPLKFVACVIALLIALPSMSFAQGASKNAPGHEQKRPGQAKQFAPGQEEHRLNKDKRPGAKEYAPGHEMKK